MSKMFFAFLVSSHLFAQDMQIPTNMPVSPVIGDQSQGAATALSSSLYTISKTCPFFVDTKDFEDQISGVNKLLEEKISNQKSCDQKLNAGNPLNGSGGFLQALNDYKQLMGLDGMNSPNGGFAPGMGSSSGQIYALNCFNVDQFYKEEAENFLTANSYNMPLMSLPGNFGGAQSPNKNERSFSECSNKSKEEIDECVTEVRVHNVGMKKNYVNRMKIT